VNHMTRLGLVGLALSLSACSVLEGDKINYRSASKGPGLEVPPDLTQLNRDSRYALPGTAVSASSFQTTPQNTGSGVSQQKSGDTQLQRVGTQQWLVINRPPEKLWDEVKDFWIQSGFILVSDQSSLGFMETDWAENRAKIPQDIIRSTLGKLLDSLYSTGEQDKFRTRLERNPDGGTDLFVSHRGMIEVYTSGPRDGSTKWQPRAADPELESEFLKRLMLKLGGAVDVSKTAAVAAVVSPASAKVAIVSGQPAVELNEGFDRAWRRVGLSLDRTGFTVEDRDRSKGTYFVRYVEPSTKQQEPGFFSKIFSGTPKTVPPLKLRVLLTSAESQTKVTVQNNDGSTASEVVAQRIVKVLADDLK
jgi:outer membrane protein assembly factor BamC